MVVQRQRGPWRGFDTIHRASFATAADAVDHLEGLRHRIEAGESILVPALQILLTDIRKASGINITLDAPPTLPELSMIAASTAYRVVAEALANVVRHSGAVTCRVRIVHTDGMLRIEVVDNGRGFEPAAATGMGLRSMSERATLANGTMLVDSSSASGTRVALEVPA
ncbi:MAG: ATP-binding protein [Ilumatobacteraceae bacterium]